MARASSSSTKFASVNLNKSYGKPASQGAQLPSSGSSRSRNATHGGMLLLTRPVRSQPAAAAVQKGAKLTVPRPVNLPSLRREHAGNDPTIALVGGTGASGWTKQQLKEAEEAAVSPLPGDSNVVVARSTPALSSGSTWGTSQPPPGGQTVPNPPYFAPVNGDLRPSSSPQTVVRSGVYTPPRARTAQASVGSPPPGPPAIPKAVVLRGEDFPTLQAALPPPPAPPQHRQKELQQKQRAKQQELKDQQEKLQQLSQKHPAEEPLQSQVVGPQLQPSQPVSLQPKREQPVHNLPKETAPSSEPQPVGQVGSRLGLKSDGLSSYGSILPNRVNQRSNWTDDEREPAQNLRPQGGSGPYSDWPDRSDRERPEREHVVDDSRRGSRPEDYGFGRQSIHREVQSSFAPGGREGGYSKEGEGIRESGFGSDGGFTREGNFNSTLSFDTNHKEGAFNREGMGSRDGFLGRDGGIPRERSHGKDGGYGRESGVTRDGGFGREGGFGRHGAFGRDGSGREFGPGKDRNLDRDGFGRPKSGGRDFIDREGFSFREGFGKETGPRDGFNRDASYGRDVPSRDGPYSRDVRRPPAGEYEGGRGRYGGERFGRSGSSRYDAIPDYGSNKSSHFTSGRGIMALDAGLDFSRDKRFGVPYTEDSFARDFPDLPGLDFRASSGPGIEPLILGLENKFGRRKKESRDNDFRDPERESFEAELERVQKAQEQERLRKIEEKERAVEMARKEQEEQERLAREEQERQLRLEEEAIAAANRAEQEALEAARKIEEERRAREEEKRQIQLEEERRKENARRKLLELEERIAKREAEKKKQEVESSLFSEDEIFRGQRAEEEEAVVRRDTAAREEEERMVTSITEADQDDDDRAPLRPSRRPPSPFMPRASQEECPPRAKSPDAPHSLPARRMPDLRGGNAFEHERSRSLLSWRRDSMDNGSGPPQSSFSGRDEGSEFASGIVRDRMYSARNYGERDTFYGSPNMVLTSETGSGDFPLRRERSQGYQERRWVSEEAGSSNKRSASPRATTPERDGGYSESSYDRDGDRHWGRDKIDRRRARDGQRTSPPPPPSYLQGSDALESSSYGGRLRHSFGKQPRVPPPLRAPLLRPPLKAQRDQSNSSPSPLLHPLGDDDRTIWDQDQGQDNQRGYSGHSLSRSQQTERPLIQSEPGHRESPHNAEMFQGKDWHGPSSTSLRPQRGQSQPSKLQSDSQDEKSDHSAGMEQEPSSVEDDSSVAPASPGSHHDQDDDASENEALPLGQNIEEGKSEAEEVAYREDEDAEDEGEDVDDQEEGFDHEEYTVAEWEEDADQEVEKSGVINEDGGTGDFNSEDYESGAQEGKEGSDSEVDSRDYAEKSPEGAEEARNSLKHGFNTDNEQKEPGRDEEADERLQRDGLQQSATQPYLQSALPSASTPLTPAAAVNVASGESFDSRQSILSQLQRPLSFMALSLPQSHAAVAPTQVPSVLTSLPVLHNAQEGGPVTLQFGLLPSTSLVPTAVPAIQIGSIQMPLHVHPQTGPQFTPLHGPPTPLFQFGQLGHHTSVPSFIHPPPGSQSLVQSQIAELGQFQCNGPSTQGVSSASSQDKDQGVADQAETQGSVLSTEAQWSEQTSKNATGGFKSSEADSLPALRPERRGRERGPREVIPQEVQSSTSQAKAVQAVGSEGALESSSSENSVVAAMDHNVESSQVGDSPWQRPYSGGRGRGNPTRWGASSSRGRGRSSVHGGKGVPHGNSEGYGIAAGSQPQDTGADGGLLRARSGRRSSFRRTEFKVRESSLQGFLEGAGSAKTAGREKYAQMSGWSDGSVASANFSVATGHRDNFRDSSSHSQDKYYGEGVNRQSQTALGKLESSGSIEGLQKQGRGSGYSVSRPGVLGKYSPEMGSESSLRSGVGQPFEQTGGEVPSDEDDFIEVRSKRQMLNDRREQKEKEMKAKTKDLKAKEQAARKRGPSTKAGFQGDSGAPGGGKGTSISGATEKRSASQSGSLDPSNNNNSRLIASGNPPTVASSPLPSSITSSQLQPPIGTPAGGSTDVAYDKRPKNIKPTRMSPTPGVNLPTSDAALTNSAPYDNQENLPSTTLAWGGTRSTLQVVSLTQIQLEEAMKPARLVSPVPQQLPLGERSSLVLEPGTSVSSVTSKEKTSASVSGPIGSLLAGEKNIQFGAVTSPPIPLTNSRPLTPGLNAVVGSSLGSRADGSSDENDLKTKAKRLPGGESEVGSFSGKGKRTRGEDERSGDGVDPEAEAEAAASAVAVAAISSDESVGSSLHGDVQNMPIRGVGLPGSGSKNGYGSSSVTSLHTITMGDATTSSVMMQASGLEESMTVALPADLSVEPTSMSLRGPVSNSSGLLLPSMPGGPLPFRGLEMGMLGGPMFGFGTSKDAPQGPQGSTSASVHEQGITTAGPGTGGWQPQHSGGLDSYYAGPPPSGFAGPFINPTGGIPSIQGPPHMLVYTNPFAPVSQFSQLGVSFMGPQQYLPSGKQPDWKHTPVSTSGPGVVGMSGNEVGGGLGGIISGQRSSGVATNAQRMAPGPSVMPTPGPFDLNMSAPFQIPGVDVSMQSQWSHVPGPPLHTVPISGPLMGFTMQTRHSRGPSHLGHLMETTSGFSIVPASNSGSSGLFQSVDPASQFPDELGLGDSSSSGTNTSSSFRGQRPSSRAPPVTSSIGTPSGGSGPGASNNKLRSGRRASRVARAGGNGSGSIPSVGMGSSSGPSAQGANGSRVQSPHHPTSSQMPPMSMGQHTHSNQYSDQRGVPQQGLPRVGIQGGWSGQGRKGGGPGRPPVAERGSSGEKPYVSSSSKLKQVYVVKPSSSPRRNIGEAASNLFSGSDVGQTPVGH